MQFAVGKGGANKAADVKEAVALFKAILPDHGGFMGLPPQPALADAEQGRCSGKDDDFLVGVIRRFQERWKSSLGLEPTKTAGTLFPKSLTMNKLKALAGHADSAANTAMVAGTAAAGAKISALIGNTKMAPAAGPEQEGSLDALVKFVAGRKTQWALGGSGGIAAGIGAAGAQWGSLTFIRPDKSELKTALAGAGLGASIAPGSISYSGDSFPGGGVGQICAGAKCKSVKELTDDDFYGKALMIQGGYVGMPGVGGQVSVAFFGLEDAVWGGVKNALSQGAFNVNAIMLESMRQCKAIGMMWGAQVGTPDVGGNVMLAAVIRPERLEYFGLRSIFMGFGGAIATE